MQRVIVRTAVGAILLALVGFVLVRYVYLANLHVTPSLAISEDRIAAVTSAAERGDADAAARLSRHYAEKRDLRASWVWMQRAKRLGYPGADQDLKVMREAFPPEATKEDGSATP
jgi:TPR repeat protein